MAVDPGSPGDGANDIIYFGDGRPCALRATPATTSPRSIGRARRQPLVGLLPAAGPDARRSSSAATTAASTARRTAASPGRRSTPAACRPGCSTTSTCGRTRPPASPSARCRTMASRRTSGRPAWAGSRRKAATAGTSSTTATTAGQVVLHQRLLGPGALHPHLALDGRRRQLSDRDHAVGHDERRGLLPRPAGHRPQRRRHRLRQRQPEPLAEPGRRQHLAHPVGLRQHRRHRRRTDQRQQRRRSASATRSSSRPTRSPPRSARPRASRSPTSRATCRRATWRALAFDPNDPTVDLRGARRVQRRSRQRRPRLPDDRRRPRPGRTSRRTSTCRSTRSPSTAPTRRRRSTSAPTSASSARSTAAPPGPSSTTSTSRACRSSTSSLRNGLLRAATYGRGVFEFVRPERAVDRRQPGERPGVRDRLPGPAVPDLAGLQRRRERPRDRQRAAPHGLDQLLGARHTRDPARDRGRRARRLHGPVHPPTRRAPRRRRSASSATIRARRSSTSSATGLRGTARLATAIADGGNFGEVCLGRFVDRDLVLNNSGTLPAARHEHHLVVARVRGAARGRSTRSWSSAGDSIALPIRFQPTSFGPRRPRSRSSATTRRASHSRPSPGRRRRRELDLVIADSGRLRQGVRRRVRGPAAHAAEQRPLHAHGDRRSRRPPASSSCPNVAGLSDQHRARRQRSPCRSASQPTSFGAKSAPSR